MTSAFPKISAPKLEALLRSLAYRPVKENLWAKPIGFGLVTLDTKSRDLTCYRDLYGKKEMELGVPLLPTKNEAELRESLMRFEACNARETPPELDHSKPGFAFLTNEDEQAHVRRTFSF